MNDAFAVVSCYSSRYWRSAGAIVSSVSLYHHYGTSKTSYCDFGENFNCDIVNRSTYSTVAGSSGSANRHHRISSGCWFWRLSIAATLRRRSMLAIASLAGLGFRTLPYVHRGFVLAAWCVLCLSSLALIFCIAILSSVLWRVLRASNEDPSELTGVKACLGGAVHLIRNSFRRRRPSAAGELRLHEFHSHIFRNTRNCSGSGFHRDTIRRRMPATATLFSFSTTGRTCSIRRRRTLGSHGRWETPRAPDRVKAKFLRSSSWASTTLRKIAPRNICRIELDAIRLYCGRKENVIRISC